MIRVFLVISKKLILFAVLFNSETCLLGSDWFRNSIKPVLKLGSGAVVGGLGALISGFSAPIVTLSALTGTWLGAEWQKNNFILQKLEAAEINLKVASSDMRETIQSQHAITTLLTDVEQSHLNLTRQLADTNRNLLVAHQGLASAQQVQSDYDRKFNSFVQQSQRRSVNLSLMILLQHRQIQRILSEQEKLQRMIDDQGYRLQQAGDLNQINSQQQACILKELDSLRLKADQNLAQQKSLEGELTALLEPGASKAAAMMSGLKFSSSATLQAILKRATSVDKP